MNQTGTETIPAGYRNRARIGNKGDTLDDGFIRLAPKTHDISLIGEHIPDIAHLAADLQAAVDACWSRRDDIRYSKAQVLLLKWADDDLAVESELKDLENIFCDLFHYGVDVFNIPNEKPDKALKGRVLNFLEHDGEETLLVLYYAGHARSSIRANEAPVWFANRQVHSPSLPSGGIQSLLEEADADVLLLYDCCNSAANAASSSNQPYRGVTEVIAACGYETWAPEVGEHSFSNALAEVLAAASKGKLFSVAELHSKVLTRLKCWTPSFVKDDDGKRKEDHAGRLLFERQPRRTPIYSIVCETEPRRSIVLGPLKSKKAGTETSGSDRDDSAPAFPLDARDPLTPKVVSAAKGQLRKRKRPNGAHLECPQVLLSIRLDKHEIDKEAWKECLLRHLPPEAKEIKIEGLYGSFSTLLLLRLPLEIWDLLPDNRAYSFVGFVTTGNMANEGPTRAESIETAERNASDFSESSSSGTPREHIPLRPLSRAATPTPTLIFDSMSPGHVVKSPLSPANPSSDISALSIRSSSAVSEAEVKQDDSEVIGASIGSKVTVEESVDNNVENSSHHDTVLSNSYGDVEESHPDVGPRSPSSLKSYGKLGITVDEETDIDDGQDENKQDFRRKHRADERIQRGNAGSASKRTLSETVGRDLDEESVQDASDIDQADSGARRLRRKMDPNASSNFYDPAKRVDESDQPESGKEDENVVVGDTKNLGREGTRGWTEELPFHTKVDDAGHGESSSFANLDTALPRFTYGNASSPSPIARSYKPAGRAMVGMNARSIVDPSAIASYKDHRHQSRRQTTATNDYGWTDWIQDERRQDREYRWRIDSKGKTVYDYRTHDVISERSDDESLSRSQYGPCVHSSAVSSSQVYENDEYGYQDKSPVSGQVNELTHNFAETSLGGNTALGQYLKRKMSSSVENSLSSNTTDSSTSSSIPILQSSSRPDPTANVIVAAGHGSRWVPSHQIFDSEANSEYVVDIKSRYDSSQRWYSASENQAQQSLSNSLVTVVPLGWKATDQRSQVRNFQYPQPQGGEHSTQFYTPADGFHDRPVSKGNINYEATIAGPSMRNIQGLPFGSTNTPSADDELPHTMLSTNISSSAMGSNTIAQVPKTIHKNIRTIQRKRSREKLDPNFRVHNSHYFKPGYIFKVLWSEPEKEPPKSSSSTDRDTVVTREPFEVKAGRYKGQKVYESIRRFIIAAGDDGHCQCLPILTYGGQGTRKTGIKAMDHAIIYTEAPILLPGEQEPEFQPIRMTPMTPRDKLDNASRINYAKIYTVEHNVKVLFIGWIEEPHWRTFITDFDTAWRRKRFGV